MDSDIPSTVFYILLLYPWLKNIYMQELILTNANLDVNDEDDYVEWSVFLSSNMTIVPSSTMSN